MRTRSRLAGVLPFLVLVLAIGLGPGQPPAQAAPALLEELRYRIEILVWQDAARVRLTFNRLGPGRYTAEIIGETLGLIKLLSGGQRERLQTEMVWRNHRLLPLIYREESWRGGKKRRLKEYRFDYSRGRLELWEWHAGKGLAKKWHTDLAHQVYDPLSAFYNCRLGILGPTREGETSTIQGIPYPQPEAMEVRLGGESQDGRQVMLSLINQVFQDSRGVVFANIDKQWVPHQAWTTVSGITVRGLLLPESVIMAPGLPGLNAPGLAASRRPPVEEPPATAGRGKSR
ncbi:MAG: DUF3108 domain-containing protein [Proteobacteria bacterium]|nr:DUF3108 domain-containing protein [Pseudomonadota bacterium]MBU4353744.1 DUF3108 domain-containing protein [Pseudomonadota bacterium]